MLFLFVCCKPTPHNTLFILIKKSFTLSTYFVDYVVYEELFYVCKEINHILLDHICGLWSPIIIFIINNSTWI